MIVWHFSDWSSSFWELIIDLIVGRWSDRVGNHLEQPWQPHRGLLKISNNPQDHQHQLGNKADVEVDLEDEDYPEQPRHPQWTHSTILPSSSLFLGTRQMQFVAKLVSRVCKKNCFFSQLGLTMIIHKDYLDATKAAEVFITLLLPLGNQVWVGYFLLRADVQCLNIQTYDLLWPSI